MACKTCGHNTRGIEVKREKSIAPVVIQPPQPSRVLLQPLQTVKMPKAVQTPQPLKTAQVNKGGNMTSCPLCRSALRPITRSMNGRQSNFFRCVNQKCDYILKS